MFDAETQAPTAPTAGQVSRKRALRDERRNMRHPIPRIHHPEETRAPVRLRRGAHGLLYQGVESCKQTKTSCGNPFFGMWNTN